MGHKIVCNRAQCLACGQEITSRHRHDWQSCWCGAIFVDGGRDYLRHGVLAAPQEGQELLRDTSILTATFERAGGLLVEAYRADIVIWTTGPDGTPGIAEPGDWVVYEPEGGSSAWPPGRFHQTHQAVDDGRL